MSQPGPTTSSVLPSYKGAKFAWSFMESLGLTPDFLKGDENKFANYFIVIFFVICFAGSLPSKIAALRYFTFLTAIINLYLGAVRDRVNAGPLLPARLERHLLSRQTGSQTRNFQARPVDIWQLLPLALLSCQSVLSRQRPRRVQEPHRTKSQQGTPAVISLYSGRHTSPCLSISPWPSLATSAVET
jgi:hypothetical protein